MIDLAETPSESTVEDSSEPRPYYPSVRFDEDKLPSLGLAKCALGDEYEITLRLKATNLSDNGSSFDIIGATGRASEAEGEEEEPAKEDKPKRETREPSKGPKIVKPPMDDEEDED